MPEGTDIPHDISINVHKGRDGFGIYFTLTDSGCIVTKTDHNSEASKAGVQADDVLVAVQDLDKKVPETMPGAVVPVTTANYHQALELVRRMKYTKLMFQTGGF